MTRVVEELGSPSVEQPEHSFAGRTDRAIISDYFRLHAMDDNAENFVTFRDRFLAELPRQLEERRGDVLPGVRQTLDRLVRRDDMRVGLLTGNLRLAAKLKLRHFDLAHYFYRDERAIGGFGDEHHDRDDVARAALADARDMWNPHLSGDDIWVVGDTPLDVKCARAISARVIGVATGGYSEAQLTHAGADLVVPNLDQAQAWWERLAA
ncbi:MAG TPA: haloacid dehalogenase-like hydrolase, partial [Pirellulaceae bacterium]